MAKEPIHAENHKVYLKHMVLSVGSVQSIILQINPLHKMMLPDSLSDFKVNVLVWCLAATNILDNLTNSL